MQSGSGLLVELRKLGLGRINDGCLVIGCGERVLTLTTKGPQKRDPMSG